MQNKNESSNELAVFNWLGENLAKTMKTLDFITYSQLVDLLSIEEIRTTLENLKVPQFRGKDVRELLRQHEIGFEEVLKIARMPAWTKLSPELYNIALQFNELQLNALQELKFDDISKQSPYEVITLLRAIALELKTNKEYYTNKTIFLELVRNTTHAQIQNKLLLLSSQNFFNKSAVNQHSEDAEKLGVTNKEPASQYESSEEDLLKDIKCIIL